MNTFTETLIVKMLLGLCLIFGFISCVSADPRMEERDGIGHFIFDSVNQDDEMKISGVRVPIYEDADGLAWGYISDSFQYNSLALPVGVERLDFTQADNGGVCTMVDDGGNQYQSETWRSIVRIGPVNQHGEQSVEVSLRCDYGTLQ